MEGGVWYLDERVTMQSIESSEPIVLLQPPREMLEPCTWLLNKVTAALVGILAHHFFHKNKLISIEDYKHLLTIDVPHS